MLLTGTLDVQYGMSFFTTFFLGPKKQLKCRHFSSGTEPIAAAETWLDGQHSDFFLSGFPKLEQRAKIVLSFVGSVLNKSRVWSL
jgi:hypothetical protein